MVDFSTFQVSLTSLRGRLFLSAFIDSLLPSAVVIVYTPSLELTVQIRSSAGLVTLPSVTVMSLPAR